MSNAFPQIQYLIILFSLKSLSISAEIVREKKINDTLKASRY